MSSKGRGGRRDERRGEDDEQSAREGTPLAEWVIGAIGALLFVAMMIVLGHDAIAGRDDPADVVIEVRSIDRGEGGWRVRARARNVGGTTAETLVVRGTLRGPDGDEEQSSAQIDYLPPRSWRAVVLVFDRDPRAGDLDLRASGYRTSR